MIGRYLSKLTPEQEDRVLTRPMAPYRLGKPLDVPQCLVVTALDGAVNEDDACTVPACVAPIASYRWANTVHETTVPAQYDELCRRFGTARINAAIRNRILRRRVARALTTTPAAPALETTRQVLVEEP